MLHLCIKSLIFVCLFSITIVTFPHLSFLTEKFLFYCPLKGSQLSLFILLLFSFPRFRRFKLLVEKRQSNHRINFSHLFAQKPTLTRCPPCYSYRLSMSRLPASTPRIMRRPQPVWLVTTKVGLKVLCTQLAHQSYSLLYAAFLTRPVSSANLLENLWN